MVLVTAISVELPSLYDLIKCIWTQFSIFAMEYLHYQDSEAVKNSGGGGVGVD